MSTEQKRSAGFTLVELLVVITIIGILVMLLMPAVQAAHEAARRIQCSNNLKQLSLGVLHHEEVHGWIPAGGWGWYWVGDPDRGYGPDQPGGWLYNTLPYIEQEALHNLGARGDQAAKKNAVLQLTHTPLTMANCPSRRRNALYAKPWDGTKVSNNAGGVSNDANNNLAARTDYAICAGNTGRVEYWPGPGSDPGFVEGPWHNVQSECNGISFECSQVTMAHIKDGPSNTLMLAEKYMCPDFYEGGTWAADNENMYVGMDNDVFRSTWHQPIQDTPGFAGDHTYYGSPHAAGINSVFCDGSVHRLSFSINLDVFHCLGSRADGLRIDPSQIK